MSCVNGCYPTYGDMTKNGYEALSAFGSEAAKLPGKAMDSGREKLSQVHQATNNVIGDLAQSAMDKLSYLGGGIVAGKDLVVNTTLDSGRYLGGGVLAGKDFVVNTTLDSGRYVVDSAYAGKDLVADKADLFTTGLSKIDPHYIGVDLTVITSSIFGSGLLAMSAVEDAKKGENTKAAIKGAGSVAVASAGAYGVYALACKSFALGAATRQEAVDAARSSYEGMIVAGGVTAIGIISTVAYQVASNAAEACVVAL